MLLVGLLVPMTMRWTSSCLTLMLLSAKVSIRLDIARSQRRRLSISERHRPVVLSLGLAGNEAAADVLLIRGER